MRRDVYIENDSGGFSVLAADAVDAIIEDQRSDDFQFVTGYKTLLLELYGDDSLPVRIVVDEPLTVDEQAQWLARASWRIDTSDGRMLVSESQRGLRIIERDGKVGAPITTGLPLDFNKRGLPDLLLTRPGQLLRETPD